LNGTNCQNPQHNSRDRDLLPTARHPPLLRYCIGSYDAGEKVVSPPQETEWGRRAVIADPDGHRVELVEASQNH
jgi:hypothetical protein